MMIPAKVVSTVMTILVTLDGETSQTGITKNDSWSLQNLFQNAQTMVKSLGGALLALLGIIMVVVAGVKIAKGLMGGQNSPPPNWIMIIVLLVVGGAFAATGITLISKLASGGASQIEELGKKGGSGSDIIIEVPDSFMDSGLPDGVSIPSLE